MSQTIVGRPAATRTWRSPIRRYTPIIVTAAILIALFAGGSLRYRGFFSGQVVLNLFVDNAFLIVLAVGMTFVILTGGIDLSVGSIVALSTVMAAALLREGWAPGVVIAIVLLVGATIGLCSGLVIHWR